MTNDDHKADPQRQTKERRKCFYRIGQTAGDQLRKDCPGRETAKRVVIAVLRPGL